MPEPLVTVVISPREGHTLTEASLLSVLADDGAGFDLIYLDIASPPKTAIMLRAHAAASNFKLVRHNDWIAPSLARKAALSEISTKYVAFADNDILVERGCLEKLLACAEEDRGGASLPPLCRVRRRATARGSIWPAASSIGRNRLSAGPRRREPFAASSSRSSRRPHLTGVKVELPRVSLSARTAGLAEPPERHLRRSPTGARAPRPRLVRARTRHGCDP